MYVTSAPRYPMAIVSRPKWPFVEHTGVRLPSGAVMHLGPSGVEVTSWEQFGAEAGARVVRLLPEHRRSQVAARAEAALRSPPRYDLLNLNCDVFANAVAGDRPESPQVQAAAVLLGLAAFLWAVG